MLDTSFHDGNACRAASSRSYGSTRSFSLASFSWAAVRSLSLNCVPSAPRDALCASSCRIVRVAAAISVCPWVTNHWRSSVDGHLWSSKPRLANAPKTRMCKSRAKSGWRVSVRRAARTAARQNNLCNLGPRQDSVVPLAVELALLDAQALHLLGCPRPAERVAVRVQLRSDRQPLLRRRVPDQVPPPPSTHQWTPPPVLGDVAEHPMLDLI